jgi:hypothetical protein
MKITDYKMTWGDLARKLAGHEVPETMAKVLVVGGIADMQLSELNEIAHALSAEVYVILRPRYPFVGT